MTWVHFARSAKAPQSAADGRARHGVRVRSRLDRRDARDMLARCGTTNNMPQQAQAERLRRTCTHAPTQRARACRGHNRTACIPEGRRWPISAQPRPGRHDQVELGVDVAVGETSAPAAARRVDGSSSQIDSCTAVDRGRARIELPDRGMAARRRARCTRLRRYFRPYIPS